jgi:hypothetical protein
MGGTVFADGRGKVAVIELKLPGVRV